MESNSRENILFFNDSKSKNGGVCGEVGVINAVLEELGSGCNYCIELGAGDGEKGSVTLQFRKNGAKSLLIDSALESKVTTEGHPSPSIGKTSSGSTPEEIINSKHDVKLEQITPFNINNIFKKYEVPLSPCLLSICLADYEYQVLEAMTYRPKVIAVIYNNHIRPDVKLYTPYWPEKECKFKNKFSHATCSAMTDLLTKKGYTLVEICKFKMIFVANKLANKLVTARAWQNDWISLYLKNIFMVGFDKGRNMNPEDQNKYFNARRKQLKTLFYNMDDRVWRYLPPKDAHTYGPWEAITN